MKTYQGTNWKLLAFLILIFLALALQPFRLAVVNGRSMFPTFNDTQLICVTRSFGKLRSGDVVLVMCDGEMIIKRIRYVAGDKIRLWYSLSTCTLERTSGVGQVPDAAKYVSFDYRERDLTLKLGQVWIEGDNQNQSCDSRFFGPILLSDIKAKVL